MPPKVKITKEEIVNTAVSLVREHGTQALNARAVATALNCSTQPIFSNFDTMEQLKEAVVFASHQHYLGFIKRELESGKYPQYKAFGMAYVRFAQQEKELFQLLFMRDRSQERFASPSADFEEAIRLLMSANGIDRETAERIHLENWIFVHGIGTMLATSYLELDEALISTMISDVYQGIRKNYATEESK